MESQPIYILGAGPAGLAAAYSLTKHGYSVVVVERESQVGGLAKSITYKNFILDFGPHRFYTKLAPVLRLWDEVLGTEQVTVNRLTRIYYRGKYLSYPLKAKEVLSVLGIQENFRILTSYFWARLFPYRQPGNFAQWVTNKFGRRLFEMFFKSYTEKLWGVPCTEISADWASQRIKGLSLVKAARNALLGNDGKVKSLVDQFQFPRLGSGQLYEKIVEFLHRHDQQVLLNTEVTKVHQEQGKVTYITLRDRDTNESKTVPCSQVISSIPITVLLKQLDEAPPQPIIEHAKSLKFRNTVLVYLIVDRGDLFPDNWLYIHDNRVKLGRISNFANWSPDMLPNDWQTPLCCEYWCNFDDELWQMDEAQLRQQAETELRTIGLLGNERVSDGFVVRLPRTYPLYAGNYKVALENIQAYFEGFENLQLIGRYGSFKYNNQDHSLLMGILAAENAIAPQKHDLWSVNTDSEYVEEASADAKTTASNQNQPKRKRGLLRQLGYQFTSYLFTGGAATIVDVLVFAILTQSGLWYVWALCISYLVGMSTNFWLSRRFVFGIYWQNWLVQYVVFAAIATNSLLANLGLLQLLVNELQWHPTWSRLVSAACVAVLSFTGHKLYSFAEKPSERFGNSPKAKTRLQSSSIEQ